MSNGMKILVIWEPWPVTQSDYLRQAIVKDGFQRINDESELIGKRIKDVRRNERDEIVFELE